MKKERHVVYLDQQDSAAVRAFAQIDFRPISEIIRAAVRDYVVARDQTMVRDLMQCKKKN